ncbi:MAG TPA: DNA polymerase III subunit alpha [Candidatus Polarisedimenticolia bacterium]|nr:DNA polymerase III subunit alpha [Candidatus Polarisedimenticolia bacterium]
MSARFAHLQVHSHYSLMRGVPGLETLCVAAEKRGFDTLALTDTDGLYGAVRFFEVAKSAGLRPILGAEVTTPLPAPGTFGDPENGKAAAPSPNGPRATLLVRDEEGYANLCRILTRRHLDPRFEVAPALAERGKGLVVLSASLPLLRGLRESRGPRGLYLALGPVGASATGARRGGVLKAIADARRLGIEPVAVNDVHFLDPGDYEKHLMLRAIDGNTTLDRVAPDDLVPPSAWFKPADDMERLVPHCPESLETAVRIADECALARPPWVPHVHPRFADIDGDVPGDAYAILVARCDAGARRRYGSVPPAVRQRLDYELAIVRDKGYADYFLVVQEIVRRSPRTCGRGSAAASIISYCLGITHVEPIRHDLYFERFLNRGRVDPPDIDVDFCWDERDDVIAWVFQAFGADKVAMITNHVTFRARAAVREIAKVHGLPDGEIQRVTDRLAHDWSHETALEAATRHPLFRGDDMQARTGGLLGRPPWPAILASAAALDGAPRHLSVHCGGVVIAPDGVDAHVPVEMSTKGVRVIQWEKDQAEDAGLVKIDLLGNRSLSVIRDACATLAAHGGPTIPYAEFDPIDDAATQAILRGGDTMGVFYVESPSMRQLQQKTRRGDFEHLVIHSSIIRPAANDYIREYVRRLRGGAFEPLHPILGEVMRDTYGIMVYQEDVARVAIRMAGFTDAEADGLRKVISKKWAEKQVADFRRRFTEGALQRGIDAGIVEQVWRMILSFSGYSFCKPHSASYALVSFKSAWLKAHHPAEFMAAVLKNEGGYYSPFAYVSECRRMGIEVRPPDVNASAGSWTGRSASGEGETPGARAAGHAPESRAARRGWIRIGLGQIVGLKEKAVDALLAAREKRGPFADFDDLLRRVPLDPADLRRLVRAGALDTLDRPGASASPGGIPGGPLAARTRLHWRLRAWETRGAARKPGKTPGLFAPEPVSLPAVRAPVPSDAAAHAGRLLRDEEEAIGYLISRHPLTLYREALLGLRRSGVQPVRGADMGKHVGERVAMVGWLVTGKIVTTKDDEPMEFVSFEDTTAIYETVFFPRAYERFCRMLTTARPYVLRGKIEEEFGVASLQVEEVEFLRRETRRAGRPPVPGKPVSRGGAAKAGVSPAVSVPAGAAAGPAAGRPASLRTTSSGRSAAPRATPDPPA